MSNFNTSIDINGHEFDISVAYTFYNGSLGARNDFGVPMEPDEQPSVEIADVYIDLDNNRKFTKITLPIVIIDEIEAEILEDCLA